MFLFLVETASKAFKLQKFSKELDLNGLGRVRDKKNFETHFQNFENHVQNIQDTLNFM